MTFTPMPAFTKMPAPLGPDSADGYDAFNDDVVAANANFAGMSSWSDQFSAEAYGGAEYNGTGWVDTLSGWTCNAFTAVRLNRVVHIAARFTCSVALKAETDGSFLVSTASIATISNSGLRPLNTQIATIKETRFADTQATLSLGGFNLATSKYDLLKLSCIAIGGRTIPAGSVLTMAACFYNQTHDN